MTLPATPTTRIDPVTEVLHGITVVDPYRWLEDGDSPEVRTWIAAQNAATRSYLDAAPDRDALRARLDSLLTTGSVGAPRARSNRVFYARRDGRRDQPVLVWRQFPDTTEQVLLDPASFGDGGLTALDWWEPSPDGSRVAYGTSRGGDELSVLHVCDTATGAELPNEQIPRTRACSLAWLPDSSGFFYTRYPVPGSVPEDEETYHRHVYRHQLGTAWATDPHIFGAGREKEDWPSVDISGDGRWLLVVVSQGWAKSEVYLADLRAEHLHFLPLQAGVHAWADGVFGGSTLFLRANENAPNFRVFSVDPENPERGQWIEVVPESRDRTLAGFAAGDAYLAIEELHNASSRLVLYDHDGRIRRDVSLPSVGSLTGISMDLSAEAAYVGFTNFTQPATAYRLDLHSGRLEEFARGEAPDGFDPGRYCSEQVWYSSADGTRVSMFLVYRSGFRRDGKAPVLLTGYGGFNVSRTPAFDATLPLWLDAGGMVAIPNLRGGGEYGETWHEAGMLSRKQNVFDDFTSAAEWLIAEGYTTPKRLAISGGSNGGLLVGAVITQRPDLFAAAVCRVPLLDMLRYHLLRIARLWIPEYGSSEDPAQFPYLLAYSPYHRVVDAVRYPATFLLTAEGDSRVDPMHARKMAARLQAASSSDAPILLRVERSAGHGQGKPRHKVVDEQVDVWSFLASVLDLRLG